MGYQIATVRLKDGREFHRVWVIGGYLTDRAGQWTPPFSEDDIERIDVTHDRTGPPVETSRGT
jgi:hypothetical protein